METKKTNHKLTQQEITSKMNDLNSILNNSWDGIAIIDEKCNFIFVNKALSPMLNYTKDELIRLNLLNLVTEKTRDTMKFAIIKAQKLGSLKNIKLECIRKDKQRIYTECSLVLIGSNKYFVLNLRDYTEKVAKDDIINKYVLSCQIDLKGNIIDISDALVRLTKYSKGELLSSHYAKLKHRDMSGEDFEKLLKAIRSGSRWSGIIKNVDKYGDVFWLDTKIKPTINKYGDVTGYILISFDITDKRRLIELNKSLEGKLTSDEKELIQRNKKMLQQTKFTMISDTIGSIAEQWLEPLDEINVNIEKIKKENYDTNAIKEMIDKIHESSKSLSGTISKFKDSFKTKDKKEITDIKQLVQNVFEMIEKNNDKDQVTINKDLHDVPKIETYPTELTDTILGVVTNSLEAFKRNKISEPLLDVTLQEKDNNIILLILDNAGGIHHNIIDSIFDPYVTVKDERGKGMGLYIARNLIESHLNGTIDLESQMGQTTATITLPINMNSSSMDSSK